MIVTSRKFVGLLLAASVAVAAPAAPAFAGTSAALSAKAPATPPANAEKRSGVLPLAGGAYAYLPKGHKGTPLPLLVIFHGEGSGADKVLAEYRDEADRDGIALLLPTSTKPTWDMVEDLKGKFGAAMNITPRYGADLEKLDVALADAFAKIAIDPARIGVMGFSDGGTYAIAVGTNNPSLFKSVIALSPGPAFPARTLDANQRIFLSHAENDRDFPFSSTRGLVARLRVKQLPVTFEEHDKAHTAPAEVSDKAFAFFMQK